MTTTTPRFEGEKIRLGGVEYVVPPLSLGQIRRLKSDISKLGNLQSGGDASDPLGGLTDEAMDTVVIVVHTALSRNYPELTKEQVSEWIDLGNLASTLQAVMGVAGLKKSMAVLAGPPREE